MLHYNVTDYVSKKEYEPEKDKLCYILMSLSLCPKGNMTSIRKIVLHFNVTEYMSKSKFDQHK